MDEDRLCRGVKRSLVRWTRALFPHVFLVLSLIAYAVFGAWLFQRIEGSEEKVKLEAENREFLLQIVEKVRNHSEEELVDAVQQKIKDRYLRWSQDIKKSAENNTLQTLQIFVRQIAETVHNYTGPAHSEKDLLDAVDQTIRSSCQFREPQWSFYGSLFFCCTVFTTVGYGNICPVTVTGRAVCMLYATVGIPLMLLVITDVGDILAMLVSKAYRVLHSSFKRLCCRLYSLRRGKVRSPVNGSTYTFSHDVVVCKPLDISQVMRTQSCVKHKATQYLNNMKIFESIITQEKFGEYKPLTRSCSCPELSQMPMGLNFSTIGQEMERLNVPSLLILFIVFAYIMIWALILPQWENELDTFEAFYFCFITLTTIGFGDIKLQHPKFFMLTFLFIITGMAIMSMAFKLCQTRIIRVYHRFICCLTCLGNKCSGNVWRSRLQRLSSLRSPRSRDQAPVTKAYSCERKTEKNYN